MNIVLTGAGIICAIGNDKSHVLSSLQEGRSGVGSMEYLRSKHKELPVGEVKMSNGEMKQLLGINENKEVSRTVLMGILSIKQALKEAVITESDKGKYRIILISGTSVGGMDITEQHFGKGVSVEDTQRIDYLKYHDCGSSTKQMSNFFNIFTDYTTISTACSSSANALIVGANMLKAGKADIVVAGGTEALTKFHLNGFNSLMILDHEQCRPFDKTRGGLNLGEGAAFVVMESEETASQRQSHILAYLSGYGNACDAYHQTASSNNGEGAYLAMKEALEMASIHPKDIQYVNAHGTGTPNNDQSETKALKRIFGKDMPYISSTKSFTGHATSASGSIETVICLLAMANKFIPANLGFKNRMADGITPTMGKKNIHLCNVLCNSFGFGGNDSSLLFSNMPTKSGGINVGISHNNIRIISRREVNSEEQLRDISTYVKPLDARRMGRLLKASLLTSLEVLEDAGLDCPDAIIWGTAYGCVENSEKLLVQMIEEDEALLKPTYFMQSTHNTVSSNIAIKTGCHGYNITYTQGDRSFDWAMRDAEMLLNSGKYKTVLVGCSEESTPLFRTLFSALGNTEIHDVHSLSILVTCGK